MKYVICMVALWCLAACQSTGHLPETPVQPSATHTRTSLPAITDSGTDLLSRSDVQRFIRDEAQKGHYSQAQLEGFFSNVVYKPGILEVMDKPGTSLPWYRFWANNASANRVNGGNAFLQQNAVVLQAVSQRYGVPVELIAAIVGIETNYGTSMGSYRVADALTTLSFHYPRRADYFQQELGQFLQMAYEEQQDPMRFKGSFAGAMGMPQFMPSSWRQWAVDWDGDGHRDIWRNVGDTAASVANYMQQHGWKTGEPVAVPVALSLTPKLQSVIDEQTALKYTAGQLRAWGVVIPARIADSEKGVLYRLETAPGVDEYWFGLNNFYAIWQYNHSRLYVAAVRQIANGVNNGAANL